MWLWSLLCCLVAYKGKRWSRVVKVGMGRVLVGFGHGSVYTHRFILSCCALMKQKQTTADYDGTDAMASEII